MRNGICLIVSFSPNTDCIHKQVILTQSTSFRVSADMPSGVGTPVLNVPYIQSREGKGHRLFLPGTESTSSLTTVKGAWVGLSKLAVRGTITVSSLSGALSLAFCCVLLVSRSRPVCEFIMCAHVSIFVED